MDFLLIPIGSAGDVHPFVGLGLALRQRGHHVTVITNPLFAPLIQRVGLEFVALGVQDESILNNPDLWHPVRGLKVVMRVIAPLARELSQHLARLYKPGRTVVAAGSLAFGARVAQDRLGIPTATIHLQPGVFRSVHRPPVLPAMPNLRWAPRFWPRFLYWLGDRVIIDPLLAGDVNTLRTELGLSPVSRLMDGWWNSPQLVLGLFPEWFGLPQPDWPRQTVLTGFPLYDERGATEVPDDLAAFLETGEPPIVFTPGSANRHGTAFFRESVRACELLGKRGLLLTRYPEQVPASLPAGVRHFDYAPFSAVLPRCLALVDHGGIGTVAQGLAAGIPQLIMPLAHDQFDNADHLIRLGVGRALRVKQYKAPRVAAVLRELLSSPHAARNCRDLAGRIHEMRPLDKACAALEGLGDRNGIEAPPFVVPPSGTPVTA